MFCLSEQVGNYRIMTDTLTTNTAVADRVSQSVSTACSSQECFECSYMYTEFGSSLQIAGDFLVAGLLSIHTSGSNPFSCGALEMKNSLLLVEAFRYALDNINNASSTFHLNGLRLGGILFDTCKSPARSFNAISEMYTDEGDHESENVVSWLTEGNEVTLGAAELLSEMNVTQTALNSDAYYLYDNSRTSSTYFMTTNSYDLAKAAGEFLQAMNWRYILVAHDDEVWSVSFVQALRSVTLEDSICILDSYVVESSNAIDVLERIAQSSSDIVVLVGSGNDTDAMLRAKEKMGSAVRSIKFIIVNPSINGLTPKSQMVAARDNFIIAQPQIPNYDYEQYLRSLKVGNNTENPWFDEYFREAFQCNLINEHLYSIDCGDVSGVSLLDAGVSQSIMLISSTINAVYASALALDLVLREHCGVQYNGLCAQLHVSKVRELVRQKMDKVSFIDDTGQQFKFNDKYFDQGYTIHRIMENGSYRQVRT